MTKHRQNDHDRAFHALLDVAKRLSASDDRQHMLQIIIDAARDVLDAERATVFEYDAQRSELVATVAHDFALNQRSDDPEPPGPIRVPLSRGLVGEAARTKQIINVPDAYADARFNQDLDRDTDFRTRSILSIPMIGLNEQLIGVVQVINKRDGIFDNRDESIAEALASQAGVAIQRARLLVDRLEREKLERELHLAGVIQRKTWPGVLPALDGYDFAAGSQPAEATGGDAYDAIGLEITGRNVKLTNPGERTTHVLLLMADAVGHGVGPALSVMQLRSMIHMGLRYGSDLPTLIEHIKLQLLRDLPPGFFITAWIGLIEAERDTLNSFSAGQAPLLHLSSADDEVRSLKADTVPFGLDIGGDLPPLTSIMMKAGDLFVVCSDGYFEAVNAAGEEFGQARVIELLRARRGDSATEILLALREAMESFTGSMPARDDCTAVVIKRRG